MRSPYRRRMTVEFKVDDLSDDRTRALVSTHLQGMRAASPAGSVFALDVEALKDPTVKFWSGWDGEIVVAIGALRRMHLTDAEIKSMRVRQDYLGVGIGRAMLRHIMSEAAAVGIERLWLETGSSPQFIPAQQLYVSEGFRTCDPFGEYEANPFSIYMTRRIDG